MSVACAAVLWCLEGGCVSVFFPGLVALNRTTRVQVGPQRGGRGSVIRMYSHGLTSGLILAGTEADELVGVIGRCAAGTWTPVVRA